MIKFSQITPKYLLIAYFLFLCSCKGSELQTSHEKVDIETRLAEKLPVFGLSSTWSDDQNEMCIALNLYVLSEYGDTAPTLRQHMIDNTAVVLDDTTLQEDEKSWLSFGGLRGRYTEDGEFYSSFGSVLLVCFNFYTFVSAGGQRVSIEVVTTANNIYSQTWTSQEITEALSQVE
jgi:hypothetical protein